MAIFSVGKHSCQISCHLNRSKSPDLISVLRRAVDDYRRSGRRHCIDGGGGNVPCQLPRSGRFAQNRQLVKISHQGIKYHVEQQTADRGRHNKSGNTCPLVRTLIDSANLVEPPDRLSDRYTALAGRFSARTPHRWGQTNLRWSFPGPRLILRKASQYQGSQDADRIAQMNGGGVSSGKGNLNLQK